MKITVSYFGSILGSLLACEGNFKVLWVHFEGSLLAYEGHFRVQWLHFGVRPSEKGSEMKLKGVRNEA